MGKIIFTNGCFDALHIGHINLLMCCRELAGPDGEVIVCLDSDEKIKKDKGKNRPFFSFLERRQQLASLGIISSIFCFNDNRQLYNIISTQKPDIIVKGYDWMGKEVVGSDLCSVFFLRKKVDISTTKIVAKIKNKK